MRTSFLLMALSAAATAQAAQGQADEKAEIDLQRARLGLYADYRSALTGTPATSALSTGDKGVEGTLIRDAAYRAAARKVVEAFDAAVSADRSNPTGTAPDPASIGAYHPIVVMGETPPSVAAYLQFRSDEEAVRAALDQALCDLKRPECKNAATQMELLVPVAIGAAGLVLSALRTDASIAG